MSSTHVGRSSLGQTGQTVRLGTHAGARASAAAFDVDDLDRARASAATASASTTFARHPLLGTERGAALAGAPTSGVGVFGRGCGGGGVVDGAITSEIQQSGGGVFGCAGVKTFPTISTGCARAPPAPPARLLRGSTPLAAFRGRAPRARVVPSRLSVAHVAAAAIVGDAAGAISADGGAFGSTAATSVAGGAACEEALTELFDDLHAN